MGLNELLLSIPERVARRAETKFGLKGGTLLRYRLSDPLISISSSASVFSTSA